MKTARLIRASAALSVLLLFGCDSVVITRNSSSASVYILAPGEIVGFVDPLEPGRIREAEVAPGPTTFTALDEDGELLATGECEVPSPDSVEILHVTWTGNEITCELDFLAKSARPDVAGRMIPRGIFWPPSPPKFAAP